MLPSNIITLCIVCGILFLIIGYFGFKEKKPKKEKILGERKNQSFNIENSKFLKDTVEKFNTNTAPAKKNALEAILVQAGLNYSYGQFFLLQILVGLFFFLSFSTVLQNPLLGIVLGIVGFNAPKQIVIAKKNRRIKILERQIGSFMNMLIQRYELSGSLKKALENTLPEFKFAEILYKELLTTQVDMEISSEVEALQQLAYRTGNKFLARMIDYYEASDSVTITEKTELMKQAYIQWNDDQELKSLLKKEIFEPVRDAYIMVGTVPVFALYMSSMDETYAPFMLEHPVGKIGVSIIGGTIVLCLWLIVNKVSAPLE